MEGSGSSQAGTTLAGTLQRLVSLVIRERPRDISLTAASTLSTLERRGPLRLTHLALSEGIAQPSMSTLVSQLESLGLVNRRHDPTDGRVVLISITTEGSQFLKTGRRGISERLSSLLVHLSAEDVATLEQATPALGHLLDVADRSLTADSAHHDAGARP